MKVHNPVTVHSPVSSYSHGIEVPPGARWLCVSGQVGQSQDGEIPMEFAEQCELAWTNLANVLASAGMGMQDIVKVNIFLVHQEDLPVFREIRDRHLAGARPASTLVFVKALANPRWLIEIEAIAARA